MGTGGGGGDSDEVIVRPAGDADGPNLTRLELQTPIVVGDESIVYDRESDYFAFARLMEASDTVLAEAAGEPIAVHSAAFHGGILGGEEVRLNYIHHLRVHPDAQSRSLFSKLKSVAVPRYPLGHSSSYAFVDTRNTAVLSRMQGAFDQWDPRPVLLEIDIATLLAAVTDAPRGRPATEGDANDIAALLSATHGHKELWPHPTAPDIVTKLERSPRDYSWTDVLVDDAAVLGVWQAGRSLEVSHAGPEATTTQRPGIVADFGYLDGAEDVFLGLMRSAGEACQAAGLTSLAILTTDRSAVADCISPLAASRRTFEFVAARLPQPAGARDLYVDPIYF